MEAGSPWIEMWLAVYCIESGCDKVVFRLLLDHYIGEFKKCLDNIN